MITKKQANADRIEANKRAAFMKKVNTLIGPITQVNLNRGEIAYDLPGAYDAGLTADVAAAAIVEFEPIGRAVFPLKVEAVKRGAEQARTVVASVAADLEKHGWDIQQAAPYPSSRGGIGKAAYDQARRKYDLYGSVVEDDKAANNMHRVNSPRIVKMSEKRIERFIENAEAASAGQYDAFVMKMNIKVGECLTATLNGNHVWGYSFLTVEKADGTSERWKTQQIVNYSVYGLPYNQWPSRKVK